MTKLRDLLIILALLVGPALDVTAAPLGTAHITRVELAKRIKNLDVKTEDIKIEKKKKSDPPEWTINLNGTFNREDWGLVIQESEALFDSENEFSLTLPISEESSEIRVVAIGPLGQTESETLTLVAPKILFKKTPPPPPEKVEVEMKPDFIYSGFSSSLGLSIISYTETGITPLSETALTGKISYGRALPWRRWDWGVNSFLTLLPLTASKSPSARFLGVNARVGYTLPFIQEPWKVSILGGFYYTTMIVNLANLTAVEKFGFSNMLGPQLFPTVRRRLNNGQTVSGYLKFSPVSGGPFLLGVANREIGLGMTYSRPVGKNEHPLSVGIDLARISLQQDFIVRGNTYTVEIQSSSYSLAVGYGF